MNWMSLWILLGGLIMVGLLTLDFESEKGRTGGQAQRANTKPTSATLPTLGASTGKSRPQRPFPTEKKEASHPAERAIAMGTLLQERVTPSPTSGRWRRERLVRSDVQDRPLLVIEEWEEDAQNGRWIRHGRDIYLADQVIVRA